jgi:hypothetical protein
MRRVLALFDAPVPALAALDALARSGVDAADVAAVPWPKGAGEARAVPLADAADAADPALLRRVLAERDVPPELRETAVDLVRRGGILLLVETPDRDAAAVAALLDAAGAADPARLEQAWRSFPGTTYDWAGSAAPAVDAPAAAPDSAVAAPPD